MIFNPLLQKQTFIFSQPYMLAYLQFSISAHKTLVDTSLTESEEEALSEGKVLVVHVLGLGCVSLPAKQ